VKLQLDGIFGNIGESKTALRTNSNEAASYADLRARIFISPDVVGIRQRPVQLAGNPITLTLWLYRN
jgi:hypothetical protein